jgi:hypothetical protein
MSEKLETTTALCAGSKVIYVCEPGELLCMTPNGLRAIVVHPDRPPKFVNADGSEEPFQFVDVK